MARLRSKFDDLNKETNTKLLILRTILAVLLGFLAISAILGIGVFLGTHD